MAHIRFHGAPMLRVRRNHLAARGVDRTEERVVGVERRQAGARRRPGARRRERGLVHGLPAGLLVDRPAGDGRRRLAEGVPRRRRPRRPGLFFCGLSFQFAFSSMVLLGAGRDADHVAGQIAARTTTPRPATVAQDPADGHHRPRRLTHARRPPYPAGGGGRHGCGRRPAPRAGGLRARRPGGGAGRLDERRPRSARAPTSWWTSPTRLPARRPGDQPRHPPARLRPAPRRRRPGGCGALRVLPRDAGRHRRRRRRWPGPGPAAASGCWTRWTRRGGARLPRVPADVRPHHGRRPRGRRGRSPTRRRTSAASHGDPELLALGLCGQGRVALYGGRVPTAMAAFDEAMLNLADPRVSPVTAGFVYCAMIEACQEISDFGRVAEWTAVLQRWCEQTAGPGGVHRAVLGAPRPADAGAGRLGRGARGVRPGPAAATPRPGRPGRVGLADYETGEVHRLRGDHAAAEAAYQSAGDHGHDPQPGLALLWLAQGRGPGGDRGDPSAAGRGGRPRAPLPGAARGGRGARRLRPPRRRTPARRRARAGGAGRSAVARCSPPRRTPAAWSSSRPATPAARCPTCARPDRCGRGSRARTTARGCGC